MHGVLPMSDVNCFFRQVDVLVLASTTADDGWGVVVSEALMCGVAVVATATVGASVVLERSLFGRCVP
ncbi:glycosyltransferase, partial [Klebsiella pneumoniae]|uniref:glycosyltransferase n=1 Tax=Klebsiella pneumoniae TaxID=573 RepID=UPI00272FF00C